MWWRPEGPEASSAPGGTQTPTPVAPRVLRTPEPRSRSQNGKPPRYARCGVPCPHGRDYNNRHFRGERGAAGESLAIDEGDVNPPRCVASETITGTMCLTHTHTHTSQLGAARSHQDVSRRRFRAGPRTTNSRGSWGQRGAYGADMFSSQSCGAGYASSHTPQRDEGDEVSDEGVCKRLYSSERGNSGAPKIRENANTTVGRGISKKTRMDAQIPEGKYQETHEAHVNCDIRTTIAVTPGRWRARDIKLEPSHEQQRQSPSRVQWGRHKPL